MTAALRSWLVNHLLSDEDLPELGYLLLELGYSVPDSASLKDFIKREMSHLASGAEADQLLLIRLCEGLIQFYLLHRPQDTPELDQLNRFLPPGLSFSPLSGRLLFVPEHYFQPHNLYVQEQDSWYLGLGPTPDAEQPAPATPAPAAAQAPAPAEPEAPSPEPGANRSQTPRELASVQRGQQFRHIRQRRLEMLKHWGNGSSLEMEESP